MKYQKGFTFFEVIISLLIISILATISASSWTNFIQKQRVRTATFQVMRILSEVQLEAKRRKTSISVQFKTLDNIPYFSKYHHNDKPNWKPLLNEFGVKPRQIEVFGQLNNLTVTFNHIGAVSTSVPYTIKIAAPTRNADPSYRRCVVVWTLLGYKKIGTRFSECPTWKGATPAKGKMIYF
ncbi:MAG: prepilin-type N-terminal cleavage/methylation domain-containing protein [Okeania sp. SIO3B5]|uniref:pilus assembly FimT family protein n=1 Tax=Okeania sp. SIO3B5 TaxID=2607811 RepID=UPI0013FFBFDC|nr:prepilin-type N-terminal cleavage/methylation domain-containing protein [Okeania sp. SIO3B5]NEO55637.1 prepilin-type N-terminal cleavage/methylation domain-containing protein [Okeania sp. SIO3B5]